ncbi:hypothetical protein [Paracoccus sp. KR1-242]|uniref:hypothetical protein n=1 Tax=Paracoccus sp. KR1-242 TaxID=3410028 RepID=UPI003C0778F1
MRKHVKRAFAIALVVPFATGLVTEAYAANCPSGFTHLGQAYKEASANNSEAKVQAVQVQVKFPPHYKLDRNYVQSGGKWAGGDAGAVMSDGDVPEGLLILAGGTQGGAKGWSVHSPQLVVIQEDDDMIIQRALNIKLYCHTGSGASNMLGHVSCNVHADICGKDS